MVKECAAGDKLSVQFFDLERREAGEKNKELTK